MKKILIFILILFSFGAKSQVPTGYTGISFRYDWLAGKLRAVHLPTFNTTPSLRPGQFTGAGAFGIDTVLHACWFYSGGIWRRLAAYSEIGVNFYVDTVYSRNDSLFYTKHGNEYFVSSFTANPGASLQIDRTYDTLGHVIDSFNAILKSLQIVQNGVPITPTTTINTLSYDIGNGDTNFGNTDITFTGDRVHDLDNRDLRIINGATLFEIDPVGFSSFLASNDGTAYSQLRLEANSGGSIGNFDLTASNDGVNTVEINGNPFTNEIALKADTLLFNTARVGSASGYVWTLANPLTGSGYWGAPVGGGTPGIDDVLAVGQQFTTDRTIDANSHNFTINNNTDFIIGGSTGLTRLDVNNSLSELLSPDQGMGIVITNGAVHLFVIPEFADNAAAVTGGLSVGDVYRTGDNLKIVH